MKALSSIRTIVFSLAAVTMFFQACGSSGGSTPYNPYASQIPDILAEANATMAQANLKALLIGITAGGSTVLMKAEGESMTGVPATTQMHLRNGAVAIAYMGYLFYRLVDEGVVKPDDVVGKWLPTLPNAQTVTLEMLLNNTSCYPDYVQNTFITTFYQDPFRQWTSQELMDFALAETPTCTPGNGWAYAHTNYVILGLILEKATGESLKALMQQYVLAPMKMDSTAAPGTPYMPDPVLHSYTPERNTTAEDATFWNPSWTLADGAVQYSTLTDTLKGFRALGRGEGLTKSAYDAMLAPHTVGMGPWHTDRYYAQGIVYSNGWLVQTPSFAGLYGIAAYYPPKDITLTVWCTKSIAAGTDYSNTAQALAMKLSEILVPDSPM